LKTAAKNLFFEMSEEQYEMLLKEFEFILKQMEFIGSLPQVDELEPMTFPYESKNAHLTHLREDIPLTPLSRDEVLKNAQDVSNGQIKLPKVVG
ncbi:MAG: Asp-tRNA(Asn)/Glu-tRNA(Gln) amidotransferase subunit GatC, partial [Bacilli bacterium]